MRMLRQTSHVVRLSGGSALSDGRWVGGHTSQNRRVHADPASDQFFDGSASGDGEAAPESHVFVDPEPFNSASFPDDLPGLAHSTPGPAGPSPTAHASAAPTLTEEQRKRMELNRRRALERKLARQQQHTGERW